MFLSFSYNILHYHSLHPLLGNLREENLSTPSLVEGKFHNARKEKVYRYLVRTTSYVLFIYRSLFLYTTPPLPMFTLPSYSPCQWCIYY